MNISLQRSHPALYIASMTSIPMEQTDLKKKLCCCHIPADTYYSLKQMCDFSLLKDLIFLMFVISNFFTSIGFNMPFIFLTDRAVDEGISDENAKWLVSAIGISNTFGRVVFGFLADRRGVNRLMLYNVALTICGVATALCPLCYNYPLLVIYACVFGLFIGKLNRPTLNISFSRNLIPLSNSLYHFCNRLINCVFPHTHHHNYVLQ